MANRMSSEPPPFGIPNRIGNTCWFQSATQCIFRNPDVRNKIMNLDFDSLNVGDASESRRALELLLTHFKHIAECNPDVSNVNLLGSMRLQDGTAMYDGGPGRDSHLAIEGYFTLFSRLMGCDTPGIQSFASPLGDTVSLRLDSHSPGKFMATYMHILDVAPNNEIAMLDRVADLFFLPNILILRRDSVHADMVHPQPSIHLPEPLDYVAAGKNINKCTTRVEFELYAAVCYRGNNADHAVALVKMFDSKKWFVFNDSAWEEKGPDSVLKEESCLSEHNWPALFFYRRK